MNCTKVVFLALLSTALITAAPQSKSDRASALAAPHTDSGASARPAADAHDAYPIGPDDVLSINIWRQPELSAPSVPVRPDGKISLPLLNDVRAANLTPMQLAEEITEQLKKYVSEPHVTVVVTAINSKRIYVLGEVIRAGAFPLAPDMTVLQALSSAGGFQQYANPKKIYVLRKEPGGKSRKIPFNYKRALRGGQTDDDLLLMPGDTVVVP
jgi:polysaccharide export outer membrane protein